MSNKLFTTIPVPRFPSNTFSLSRSVMFAPRLQKLYTPNVIEIIPGDGINERSEQFARTQPMVTPVFTKMNAFQEAFFVPNWQLNEHFDDFITGGEDGTYQDKMPWTTVSDLYNRIYTLLRVIQFTQFTITADEYNMILEKVQSIIEHIDLMRALPIVLPDFQQATPASLLTVASSNLNAFSALNSTSLSSSSLRVNYNPFGAVLKVWCEYYRDENLCDDEFDLYWKGKAVALSLYASTGQVSVNSIVGFSLALATSSKDDFMLHLNFLYAVFGAHNRAWKKDYFTSALPFTQKGPDVLLPLSGVFPVDFSTGAPLSPSGTVESVEIRNNPATSPNASLNAGSSWMPGNEVTASVNLQNQGLGSTIVDVRRAFALEEFYEADGRGGNRYPENTMMQFGVKTPDSRLPRAQYLGGNSSPVQIAEVVQNSATVAGQTPQGTLAGKGTSYGNNRLCRSYNTMHGFLLNFYSVRTQAIYENGIHPMFSRYDRTEYAWPRFAHLGEQPVHVKELWVDSTVTEDETFGYTPRYSEYKSERSSVHGPLKGSLNFWTMSRKFGSKPQLSEDFIYNTPRLDAFAVTNKLTAPLIVEIDYRVRANRKLPFFGVPMI